MNPTYQDEKSRRAFIMALQRIGLLRDESGSIQVRPYIYRDSAGKLLVQGYFYPYPRHGLSLVGLVFVEPVRESDGEKELGFRFEVLEFKDWELSPNPIPDAFVWLLGECICTSLNLFRSACVTAKQLLALTS